jgi:hypothetical protein
MSIYTSVNNVLSRLDDPLGERYTRTAVEEALELGSDTLLRRTEILWDCEFYNALARTGNVTSRWEQSFLIAETQATFYCGLLNYTGGHWEKEYLGPEVFANGASGPVQVTAPWETEYSPEVIDPEVFELPERLARIDRVTWDYRTLDPQTGNSMRRFYGEFKNHHAGNPRFFIFNEDGLRTLRVSPTLTTAGTTYTYSGSRGLLRNDGASEFADTTYRGNRGILRATDNHIQCGSLRGHPVRLHADNGNLRVEFFRTTGNLEEVPSRYVRAVEDYACASVLIDEGPGQDRALGGLYSSRFNGAVDRLRKRVNKIRQQRTATFGGLSGRGSTPYARLPQAYPENG